jgi:hypothetical protein
MNPDVLKTLKPLKAMFLLGHKILEDKYQSVCMEYKFMDLFGFNYNGESCEIEIKTSDYDFHKEFAKGSKVKKHDKYLNNKEFTPTFFYFMVNKPASRAALKQIELRKLPYGLIVYDGLKGTHEVVIESQRLSEQKFVGKFNEYEGIDFRHKI